MYLVVYLSYSNVRVEFNGIKWKPLQVTMSEPRDFSGSATDYLDWFKGGAFAKVSVAMLYCLLIFNLHISVFICLFINLSICLLIY